MSASKLRSPMTSSNYEFVALHPTMMSNPNHAAEPTFPDPCMLNNPSGSTGRSCYSFTDGQYSTNSISASPRASAIPQPQSIYSVSYPTTATSVSNYDALYNPPSLHSTQYNPVLGNAIVRHFSSPLMGSNYSSPYTFQMQYSDDHPLRPTFSSQYTVTNQDTPFIFDPEMTASGFPPYNELSYQRQNFGRPSARPFEWATPTYDTCAFGSGTFAN
ncbi:hypothetical protein DFH29DRAFT_999010 [Suillus ampliporus]|nr:hypothetical protein DFH29DRAFT_999010 [Suillus ampliporus]